MFPFPNARFLWDSLRALWFVPFESFSNKLYDFYDQCRTDQNDGHKNPNKNWEIERDVKKLLLNRIRCNLHEMFVSRQTHKKSALFLGFASNGGKLENFLLPWFRQFSLQMGFLFFI